MVLEGIGDCLLVGMGAVESSAGARGVVSVEDLTTSEVGARECVVCIVASAET